MITGMSGTGKTVLLEALRREGHVCFQEPARMLLEARLPEKGDGFARSFVGLMLKQSIADFDAASAREIVFYDRGLPDTAAYAIRFGLDPGPFTAAAEARRYERDVFVAPPWPEIFEHDEYRRAPYDEYLTFHHLLLETYRALGYSLVELPKVPLVDRVAFIRSHTGVSHPRGG